MNRPPVPVPDYPSNSMASKAKSKPPVETTMVQPKKQKKSSIKSMWDEHSDDVKSYILYDILAPAVKDMVSNIVGSAVVAIKEQIDTMLYGSPRSSGRSYNRPSYTDYSGQYKSRNRYSKTPSRIETVSYNKKHGVQNDYGWFDDIQPFKTRKECEDVLNRLITQIEEYDEATVGDLYDFSGNSKSYDFTDRKWGWKDLSQTDVIRIRDGYIIANLPAPQPLS